MHLLTSYRTHESMKRYFFYNSISTFQNFKWVSSY